MAAALLVWLYATGGFSLVVAQQDPGVERTITFDGESVQPGATLSVTITKSGFVGAVVTEMLPPGLLYLDSDLDLAEGYPKGRDIQFTLFGPVLSNTYRVMVPETASLGAMYDFEGTAAVTDTDFVASTVEVGGDSQVTVGTVTPDPVTPDPVTPDPVTPDGEDTFELSSYVATEGVRIELDANSGKVMVPAGEDLTITLKKFGLPSSIPESSVLILGKAALSANERRGAL